MLTHSLADSLLIAGFGLLLALMLDGLARIVPSFASLWQWPGTRLRVLVDGLDTRLNRRRDAATLRGRGVLLTLCFIFLAALAGFGINRLAMLIGRGGVSVEILAAAWCFASAGPLMAASTLRAASASTTVRLEQLREDALPYLPKDALVQDRFGLIRAMAQTLAQGLRDRFFAPLLGAVLFGLPGLLAMRLAALLAWRWTKPSGAAFSASVRSLWKVMGWPASVLAATSLALAAFVTPGVRVGAAWRAWWMHARGPEGAVAVMAGALQLQLAGPRLGQPNHPWLGTGTPKPAPLALRDAAWLHEAARWMWALLLICTALRFV